MAKANNVGDIMLLLSFSEMENSLPRPLLEKPKQKRRFEGEAFSFFLKFQL